MQNKSVLVMFKKKMHANLYFCWLVLCILKYAQPWSSVQRLKTQSSPEAGRMTHLLTHCVYVRSSTGTLPYCLHAFSNCFFHWPESQLSCVEACCHTHKTFTCNTLTNTPTCCRLQRSRGMQWELGCYDKRVGAVRGVYCTFTCVLNGP